MYSAGMDVPHYWTADQVQRLLDALASHNRHQARTAALIMWRAGLRVSEVLGLEWRDLNYAGDPATLLVRRSKTRKARTVRLHPELVQLFTNWPANRSPRDKVRAAGHEDGAAPHRRRHPVGGSRRGIARHREASPWRSQPAAQRGAPLADGRRGPAQRGFILAGPCQRAGDAPDLPAHRGQRLRHGERALGMLFNLGSVFQRLAPYRLEPTCANELRRVCKKRSMVRELVPRQGR